MKLLKKIDAIITYIEEYAITIFLILMTVITFWGVINRFILKESLSWAEEAARYLSIWAAFVGGSLGVKKGVHIGVEAFVAVLPHKLQEIISYITTSICIVFCGSIAYIGYDYCLRLLSTGQLSPAMRMPIVWAYAAIPSGCFLMSIRYTLQLIKKLISLKTNTLEKGSVTNG